jgi:2-polyprenyl-3-methyl-5-hydroxy-6-metoxy-1,4-benzoquinol methylase
MRKDENHVKFVQRDACNLPSDLGLFHCAIAANLIDRLSDPSKFLRDVGKFILPGGFLILLSPYTWL